MEKTTADLDRLAAQAAAATTEQPVILLLRHGERERIASSSIAAAVQAALTDGGRAQARLLGQKLPLQARVRLFYSPVPRCHDTAQCIAEGYQCQGGTATVEGPLDTLGATFVRDPEQVVSDISRLGLRPFLDRWLEGGYPTTALQPPKDAANDLLQALVDAQAPAEGRPAVDLHISHDLVILALLATAGQEAPDALLWPGFLDGVALQLTPSRPTLWYQGASRDLELPKR